MKKNLPKELKRILITGGGGFIGGALIRFLLNKTEYQIYNLDKSGYSCDFTSINLLLKNNKDFQERYFFLNVDLKDEINGLYLTICLDGSHPIAIDSISERLNFSSSKIFLILRIGNFFVNFSLLNLSSWIAIFISPFFNKHAEELNSP